MRWGVRDEATDDHMTTELCMKEIDNGQRLSMGPNFVVSLMPFTVIQIFSFKCRLLTVMGDLDRMLTLFRKAATTLYSQGQLDL